MRIVERIAGKAVRFGRRFARETQGNIAIIFALVLPLLIMITLGGIDINRASTVRSNLQDALDAATLAAARSEYEDNTNITRVGMDSLRANLAAFPQISLDAANTTFVLNTDGTVIADARVNVTTIVAGIVMPPYGRLLNNTLPVRAHTEVNRSTQNVEVALVLDTTGSMVGQRIADLKLAAKDLVDIVVQDQQSPVYSKVSLIPYSMAVNVGTGATTARGTPTTSTNITSITWYTGTPRLVTATTRASPAVVTAAGHGFSNGDKVVIWGQANMSQMNGRIFTVANRTTNSFQLSGIDSRTWTAFANNSLTYVAKCARSDCYATVNANSHGIPDNGYVVLQGVGGMTQLNDQTFKTEYVNANQYIIETVAYGVYSSGGQSWCAQYGCTYRAFINADGDLTTHDISTCVSERTGANAYTDVAPATSRVSYLYPSTSNPCITNLVRPLSSDRTTIKSQIDALTASGSTGGQIGVAWGWYSLSPNFNAMWPSSGDAGPYGNDTLKAVVIMTDGEYNSAYCSGVISQDSTNGSGASSTHINCDATNGSAFSQTQALCTAMKAAGVIVYTVGFQVVNDQRARDLVNGCATDEDHIYMPNSGADLRESFQAIGRDITALRIAR